MGELLANFKIKFFERLEEMSYTLRAIANDFWNPDLSFLENLYYNEAIWFGTALLVLCRTGGQGCLYVLILFPVCFCLGHAVIISLGIETFFTIFLSVIAFVYFIMRRQYQ